MCYPGSDARPVYLAKGKCAVGYESASHWCIESKSGGDEKESYSGPSAADQLASYGSVPKANPLNRCPIGYFSKDDMKTCTTALSPSPVSRTKKGACRADEIDEWGLYCTANATVITRSQAEQEATRDFNTIYSNNMAQVPPQTPGGADIDNSAPMVAAFGPKPNAKSAETGKSAGNDSNNTAQCETSGSGSASGAAIGGAVAGDAGAVLGSVLGGLGKKKKKKNAC